MTKISAIVNKKELKDLNAKLKILQAELLEANKMEGKDSFISVKVKNNQARFERVKQKGAEDKAIGKFYLEVEISAKESDVFVPLSIASGKKTAGFMYQIEGTGLGSIVSANVKVRGDDVKQITLGTLLYAKIPAGKKALFEIRSTIKGNFGKSYKLVFARINYKLKIAEARYQQYLKEIHSDSVFFK